MSTWRALMVTLLACLSLAGCVSQSVTSTQVDPVKSPAQPIPESQLLDVGIVIFDPGLEGLEFDDEELPVYPEVRRAEALFLPNQIVGALQESGAWGAVRVLPDDEQLMDIILTGTIEQSDGETLQLAIIARDSTGKIWLDKAYEGRVSTYAYTMAPRLEQDPFQGVFNEIANDLLAQLESKSAKTRRDIRLVTEMRFARDFSPAAFDDYLVTSQASTYQLARLPAAGDPMLARVKKIRERDHLFIDTLQGHYLNFDEVMSTPYNEWRKLSHEEVVAYREMKAESMRQLITGVVSVAAGIAMQVEGDSSLTRAAGQIGMIGGAYAIQSGLYTRNNAQIHVDALEELGMSLEEEIAPRVIELEDQTVTLSGSVDEQYAQWRELLAEIYRAEVGDLDALPVSTESSRAN